jgi:SHS2 domain-containing protein
MFETFDHTADLGLRVRSDSLNGLFEETGRALFSTIVEDPATVQALEQTSISITGRDHEYLLFDWMKELLYRFDAEHQLFSRFNVRLDASGLAADVWGERLDLGRHVLNHEVKAITYHGLKVERTAEGWLAEIILDI